MIKKDNMGTTNANGSSTLSNFITSLKISPITIVIAVVFFILIKIIPYILEKFRTVKMLQQIPSDPALPLLGHLYQMYGPIHGMFLIATDMMKRHGPTIKLWLAHFPLVVLTEPEHIQIAFTQCLQKDDSYKYFDQFFGQGLITASVEKWKSHRRIVNSAFNVSLMAKDFLKTFNKESANLVNSLKKELSTDKHFDMWKYVVDIASLSITQTSMGVDEKDVEEHFSDFHNSLDRAGKIATERIYKVWLHPDFIFNIYQKFKGYDEVGRRLMRLPTKVMKMKREEFEKKRIEGTEKTDYEEEKTWTTLIDKLLKENATTGYYSDKEILDEVLTFITAGTDTVSVTVTSCFLMLAMNQDVQNKAYKELYGVFGDDDREATLEELESLKFLEQCLHETLRYIPPVPLILRKTTEDTVVGKYTIPRNTTMALWIYKVHRNPKEYPNPDVWNPDNFSPEAIEKRHRYSFIPFGGGPRICLGLKYAMLFMKTMVSSVLRNYWICTDKKMEDIELRVHVSCRVRGGYQVKLYPRSEQPELKEILRK